jgi:hypothetical protein
MAPVLLKTNRRIRTLIIAICLALLMFCPDGGRDDDDAHFGVGQAEVVVDGVAQ